MGTHRARVCVLHPDHKSPFILLLGPWPFSAFPCSFWLPFSWLWHYGHSPGAFLPEERALLAQWCVPSVQVSAVV